MFELRTANFFFFFPPFDLQLDFCHGSWYLFCQVCKLDWTSSISIKLSYLYFFLVLNVLKVYVCLLFLPCPKSSAFEEFVEGEIIRSDHMHNFIYRCFNLYDLTRSYNFWLHHLWCTYIFVGNQTHSMMLVNLNNEFGQKPENDQDESTPN